MLSRPEILAPAGTFDSVVAAVNAGADACYVGGDLFSARAYAGNFDKLKMLEAINYCHINNVRIYMAVNTLLKNDEIANLISYIKPFYEEGVDGIIVQDMGAVKILSEAFPDLPLHASTQMSICSSFGAAFLKEIGFSRLVPARELSLKEVKKIKNEVDIEIETFVHGAMCFSYSGKCLMSSFAGGRSGNRGRCAQPCRKAYNSSSLKNEYALSMKDMCMLSDIPDLIDAGIDSFKIEGRMKKPEYVASAVRAYRDISDAYISGSLNYDMIKCYTDELMDIYNRGGFSSGYYFMQNGKNMLANKRPNHTGILIGRVMKVDSPDIKISLEKDINKLDILEVRTGREDIEITSNTSGKAGKIIKLKGRNLKQIKNNMPVYRTRNDSLIEDIRKNIIGKEKRQTVSGKVTAKIGEPITLTLISDCKDVSVNVLGEVVSAAKNHPVSIEQIIEKLSKTGGTGMEFSLQYEADENIFIPIGSLNKLRRDAVCRLNEKIAEKYRRVIPEAGIYKKSGGLHDELTCEIKNFKKDGTDFISGFTVSVKTAEQLNIINNFKIVDNIIIDYNIIHDIDISKLRNDRKYFLELPDVLRESRKNNIKELISDAKMPDGIIVKNIDQLGYLHEADYKGKIICDSFLYAYNDFAFSFYKSWFDDILFIGSVELTHNELMNLNEKVMEKIYGYQPVMITAQCFEKNYENGCGNGKCQKFVITDENNNNFHSINYCRECYSVIYNGLPTDNIDKILSGKNDSKSLDMKLAAFTLEDEKKTEQVMKRIAGAADITKTAIKIHDKYEFTRGHYIKGIE